MNGFKRFWRIIIVMAAALLALGAASAVRADEPQPIIVVAGDTAPAQAATADEEDPPPAPNALEYDYDIYVSAPGNGVYGAITYADEDVLRYTTKTGAWVKVFDGTNEGLPAAADIDALAFKTIDLGQVYYLSFDAPVAVPGLGTVDDSDVVAHTYVFGQGATWSLFFDGSAHGLTTDGEDVDAIEVDGSTLYLSTAAGFSVPKVGGGTLKGADEDVFVFASQANAFGLWRDGGNIGLTATNNVRGFAFMRYADDDIAFYVTQRAAQLKQPNSSYAAVALSPNDIGVEERHFAGPTYFGVLLDASAAGFPKVDAVDLVKKN